MTFRAISTPQSLFISGIELNFGFDPFFPLDQEARHT